MKPPTVLFALIVLGYISSHTGRVEAAMRGVVAAVIVVILTVELPVTRAEKKIYNERIKELNKERRAITSQIDCLAKKEVKELEAAEKSLQVAIGKLDDKYGLQLSRIKKKYEPTFTKLYDALDAKIAEIDSLQDEKDSDTANKREYKLYLQLKEKYEK